MRLADGFAEALENAEKWHHARDDCADALRDDEIGEDEASFVPEGDAVFEVEPEVAAGLTFGLQFGDFGIGEGEKAFCACFGVSPIADDAPEKGDEEFDEIEESAEIRAFTDGDNRGSLS